MWSQLINVATMSKGALVVGIAASAAMVSNAEFSNTPSHNEVPSTTPIVEVTPGATRTAPRPANSPSSLVSPKSSEVPAVQLPVAAPSASPSSEAKSGLAHGEVPGVIKECVEKYLALREQGDNATTGERRSTGEVCRAALALSGLSGAEFWAKFGPATHSTAPKTEPSHNADLEALIKECLSQHLAGTADQSDACHKAIAASGLSPQEFWTKFGPSADTAKHELSADALHWVRECVTKYTAKASDASATCRKAIELTGLTSAEFAAKFLFKTSSDTRPSTTTTKPAPTAKPETTIKPVTNTAELSQLVAKCLDLYKTITSTGGDTKAASDACRIAIQASGLSSADFWAKYHPTTTTN